MAGRRKGRGRLSSIELLPEDAEPIIAWAAQQLKTRSLPQIDILAEFNTRLSVLADDLGIAIQPISPSAFNRYSVRLARMIQRIEQTREIASVLTDRLEPGQTDDLTIAITESIKTLIFQILENADEASLPMKAAKEAAEALRAAVAAEKMSSERRRKVEQEIEAKATAAIDKVAKTKGLNADTVAQLRREFLGLRK